MKLLQDLLHIAANTLPIWRDLGLLICAAVLVLCLVFVAHMWHGPN